MARTAYRTKSKSSSSSSRKVIAKAQKVTNFTCATRHDHSHKFLDSQITRLLARGITLEEAFQLIDILQCSVEELIRMYKCRKSMLSNVVAKARVWMSKKKQKPPPKKSDDEIIHWIGDYCEVFRPLRADVRVGAEVMVTGFTEAGAVAARARAGHDKDAVVKVADMYKHRNTVGKGTSARQEIKWCVVGTLRMPFHAYYGYPSDVQHRLFSTGCKVRFYVDHIAALVHVSSDEESNNDFKDSDDEE